ncbi:MAG TPA: serine/threonine-protein kinase, partial [Pyrinomonadaceae bacterium]
MRAQIGAGGMGVVYKAFDPLLKRPVALKVLPAELIQNSERVRRFRQEAEAASALNHPAIITIYEIGEGEPGIARPPGGASGAAVSNAVPAVTPAINYIAMEFIEGATLRDAIHHESADLLKLLGYVTQVVGGLAKAHDKGIIHRDLKPNNIMVTLDGFAKILDFGLAKLVERANQPGPGEGPMSEAATAALPPPSLSKKGMLIGTIGYMSPEQAQGKVDEVDERSDVFACGCILYECVTGRLPFRGASELDTLHKIVYEPPPPDELAPHAPPELRRIIDKCLSKGADLRYQTARELALDLKQVCHELESRPDLGRTRLLARSLSAPDRPPSDQGLWKTPRRRAARAETAGRDAAPPSPRSHSRKAVNTLAVL